MGKFKSVSAAVLVAGLLLSGTAAPANAAGCVSQSEFSRLKNGMTVSQVTSVTGTSGTRSAYSKSGSYSFEIRSYKACTQFGAVSVGYMNGRVSSKTGVF